MVLVEPKVTLVEEHDPLLKLERCIRVCYKSENKICDGSAEKIIKVVLGKNHTSVLEHYRIKFLCSGYIGDAVDDWQREHGTAFIRVTPEGDDSYDTTLTGNFRAFRDIINSPTFEFHAKWILQNGLHQAIPVVFPMDDMPDTEFDFDAVKYIGEDPDYFTVNIVTDRGVLQEIARSRSCSPSVESTRYCNYTPDKKGLAICYPEPFFWTPNGSSEHWTQSLIAEWADTTPELVTKEGHLTPTGMVHLVELAQSQTAWEFAMMDAEKAYNYMISKGRTPQEARSVLPNSLKVELMLTATVDAWKYFISLRSDKAAHPQINIISDAIQDIIKTHFSKEK